MNQRVASTPMRSISSSSVTKSPRRLDIFARPPPSTMWTNCRIGTSTRSGSSPSELRDRLQPRDVAVVVGAEHVDRAVEPAQELVLLVGDVGREVRRRAGRAPEHAVLVVAERRSCAATARPRTRRRGRSSRSRAKRDVDRRRVAFVQRALEEVRVELDAVALQRRADALHDQRGGLAAELAGVALGGVRDPLRDLRHVVARSSRVLGHRLVAGAQAHRRAELVDLRARRC